MLAERDMSHRRGLIAVPLLFAVLPLNGLAQDSRIAGATSPFEAISIKESTGARIPVQWQGTRFLAGAIPLQTLLIVAYQVPFYQLSDLPDRISTLLGRPVEDRTGLTGFFDVELRHRAINATAPVDTDQPDLITAVQEQLGLKIESTRGSVQVTVFDRIERPTAN